MYFSIKRLITSLFSIVDENFRVSTPTVYLLWYFKWSPKGTNRTVDEGLRFKWREWLENLSLVMQKTELQSSDKSKFTVLWVSCIARYSAFPVLNIAAACTLWTFSQFQRICRFSAWCLAEVQLKVYVLNIISRSLDTWIMERLRGPMQMEKVYFHFSLFSKCLHNTVKPIIFVSDVTLNVCKFTAWWLVSSDCRTSTDSDHRNVQLCTVCSHDCLRFSSLPLPSTV